MVAELSLIDFVEKPTTTTKPIILCATLMHISVRSIYFPKFFHLVQLLFLIRLQILRSHSLIFEVVMKITRGSTFNYKLHILAY